MIIVRIFFVFILITLLNVTTFDIFLHSISAGAIYDSIKIKPRASFQTPSTNQLERRFLPIGNFLDTTNNAYFYNSQSYLEFAFGDYFPDLDKRDILVKTIKVSLYKYANSMNDDIDIKGKFNGIDAVFKVNELDYDFQKLEFNFNYQNLTLSENNKIELFIENPSQFEGIAVCSGVILDSLCGDEYSPVIEIEYQVNTKGELIDAIVIEDKILNSQYKNDLVICSPNNGCSFDLNFLYEDIENNSDVRLVIKNKDSQTIETLGSSLNMINFDFLLADGDYNISLIITDGSYKIIHDLTEDLLIRTKLPPKPKIDQISEKSSKYGFEVKFQSVLPENYELITNQSLNAYLVSNEQNLWKIKTKSPELEDRKIEYVFSWEDKFGNLSPIFEGEIEHSANLLSFDDLNLSNYRISPRNADKKFDQFEMTFSNPGDIRILNLEISDISYTTRDIQGVLNYPNQNIAENEFFLSNYEVAELKLSGIDFANYPLLDSLSRTVIIDNEPAKINKFKFN